MIKQNRLIVFVLIAVLGFAVWQSYQLRLEHKTEKLHIAQTVLRAAYFLHTTQQSIDSINKKNEWNDLHTRNSFRVWLSYTIESLNNANSTLNDFQSLVSFKSRQNINDIYFQYSDWWMEVAKILDKSGPLSTEDKKRILELSQIVSKVDDFYPHKTNDWEGILAAFARLNEVWKN